MALEILYYGADTSHRVPVLVAAGYAVENCTSSIELIHKLESGEEILAILFWDQDGVLPIDEIAIARARSSAPLVLFRDSAGVHDASDFDFVIPNLTPPAEWLDDIAFVIEQHRRSTAQEPSRTEKVQSISAPPSKIRRMERETPPPSHPDLEQLGPPAVKGENRARLRYIM